MTPTALDDAVATAVAQLVGHPVRTSDRLIEDLAFDSLHLYELAIALDELVPGVELPEHLPVEILTVGDVARLLHPSPP